MMSFWAQPQSENSSENCCCSTSKGASWLGCPSGSLLADVQQGEHPEAITREAGETMGDFQYDNDPNYSPVFHIVGLIVLHSDFLTHFYFPFLFDFYSFYVVATYSVLLIF